VLTFKTQQTSSPQYLNQHISLRTSARNTRSSSIPLLCVPFQRTLFARRSFSTAAPLTWNSLPPAVLNCDSLSTFKSRLKTHLFSANYSTYLFRQRLCSRLTALWRYINYVLLLLLLLSTSPLLCVLCHSEGAFHYNSRIVITLISLGSQNERYNDVAVYLHSNDSI